MPHPAVRQRTLSRSEPPGPPRRPSRWWYALPWIAALGLLGIMRVNTQARLSELDWQSRRLDRMMLEQQTRRGELLRERARLTSNERLSRIAAEEGMVPPAVVKPVALGGLPPARLYWELPDESGVPSALSGQQVGQLPQPPAPPGSAQS